MIMSNIKSLPAIEGQSLTGQNHRFPQDFNNELNLVILSFYDWQLPIRERWIDFAKKLTAQYENLEYFECPMLTEDLLDYRESVNSIMNKSIISKQDRSKVITVYTDKFAFLKSLDITNDRRINALLMRKDGTIIRHVEGYPNETVKQKLSNITHLELVVERL